MTESRLNLLIVEDDPAFARLVADCAAARGITVTCATAPAEARAALAREPFDVAVVDLALGAHAGFDVLRTINDAYPHTSIVVMSANASISSAMTSQVMAAFAYVQKPFEVDDLLRTVERAAEHGRITRNNRRLLWELQTINDVADGIAHSLERDDVLKGALERLCRGLAVPNAAIRLKDETTGVFEVAALVGPVGVRGTWDAHGGPVPRPSDAVIVSGRPVVLDDMASLVDPSLAPSLLVRSAVSVPMVVSDELIGTLTLTCAEPKRFSAADARLLTTIGSQIGASVQSARLHGIVRRAKQEWEQTFDAIANPIGVYDAAGRLLRGNAALAAALGCTVRDLPGRTCGEVGFCGGGCPGCAVGLSGQGPRRDEITRSDGQIFSVTTFPMRSGTGGALVQVAKNVTQEIASARQMQALSDELAAANRRSMAALVQLKNTQAQLLQAEKLSAIGQLVAGVAHELNNPLTSVIGYAQLLHEEVRESQGAPLNAQSLAHDLQRIAEESERAARIVRNLLAFARRQSAARALQQVEQLVDRTLALREYALRSSGVELEKALAPDLPPVLVDANQFQQAILNLILNAEHAMRGQPVRRLRVAARLDAASCAVELSVEDTGHGIDPAHVGRIFDPFFTTRDVGEGTGLGLSICYGIVRDHGGHITVHSRPGEGTTFSLLLPARLPLPRGDESVLVVHAEGEDHDIIATALEAWGYQVSVASSCHAGLEQYRHGRFDCLVVEARLVNADLSGWQAATTADARRTPVILLGLAEERDIERFGSERGRAVLVPPYHLSALRAAVRAVSETCV